MDLMLGLVIEGVFAMVRYLTACAALLLTVAAAPALAQPHAVASSPTDGAQGSAVAQVTITFSEPVVAASSGVAVIMTGMPGMADHPPMPMPGVRVSLSADGRTLTARLPRALPIGTYVANWHAAGADAVRATGKIAFTVK